MSELTYRRTTETLMVENKKIIIKISDLVNHLYDSNGSRFMSDNYSAKISENKIEITWRNVTSVEDESEDNFSVASFPNPFSGSTAIEYTLDKSAVVRINIYDNLGNIITTLKDEYTDIGSHSDVFNADKLPSGMYYYTIQIDKQIGKGKLLLIR